MAITNKQALEAIETLKGICKSFNKCVDCPFHKAGAELGEGCSLLIKLPEDWELPSPARWTKKEKKFAEALMIAGVKSVHRCGNTDVVAFHDGFGDFMFDDYGRLKFFKALQANETVDLSEIVNSEGERADE